MKSPNIEYDAAQGGDGLADIVLEAEADALALMADGDADAVLEGVALKLCDWL